ncbi:MAG: hypothetical protein ABL983_00165 [Nitrospira sp.]
MTKLMRAQIGRGRPGIDTTVKSAQGIWRAFAPQYPMVMGHKAGTISDAQYIAHYEPILARVPALVWDTLAERETQCLLCYCRDHAFCHSHLIIAYAVNRWPDRFQDGREPGHIPPGI